MPELPEVETIRRDLARKLKNVGIRRVTVHLPKITTPRGPAFARALRGAQIIRVKRRAKLLLLETNRGVIMIHLKMTGQLVLQNHGKIIFGGHPIAGVKTVPNKYTHVQFDLSNGNTLYFNDLRKFGYLKLLPVDEAAALLKHIGVEPLTTAFTPESFEAILARRKGAVLKAALLDQTGVAGVGNIYVDEACWRARVRPNRRVGSLKPGERRALWRAIREVLTLSIKHRGTSFNSYVDTDGATGGFWRYRQAYGRKGQPCRRCGTLIVKTVAAGRGTHYCPKCQK